MSESVKLALHKQKASRQAAHAAGLTSDRTQDGGETVSQHLGSVLRLSKIPSPSSHSAKDVQLGNVQLASEDASMPAQAKHLCEADNPCDKISKEQQQQQSANAQDARGSSGAVKPLPNLAPASLHTALASQHAAAKTLQTAQTSKQPLNSNQQLPVQLPTQPGTPDASHAGLSNAPSGIEAAPSLEQQQPEQKKASPRASIDTRPQLWQVTLGNAFITAHKPVKHSNGALPYCPTQHSDTLLSLREATTVAA